MGAGCGGKKSEAVKSIEPYAVVTNYKPSGGVAAVELAWKQIGVEKYRVTVLSPEGTELWKKEVANPPVLFTTEGVVAQKATWQVEGFDGTTLRARSKPTELSLAPQPGSPDAPTP
jgi:hypothetical protein